MKIRSDGPTMKINFVVVLVKVAYRGHRPLESLVSPVEAVTLHPHLICSLRPNKVAR